MKREFVFIFILLLATLAIFFLKPMYGWNLRAFMAPPSARETPSLLAENQRLKAELAVLENIQAQIPKKPEKYTRAVIYSHYPFNFKNELLAGAGARENVAKGKVVVFDGILIGKISEVFEDTSVVQTIFDERVQFAVRIGKEGAQGLFTGGAYPMVKLISPTASVLKGDIVYSAAPDFPYGLPVAEINDVELSPDRLFQSASLNILYDAGRMGSVLIAQ